MSHLPGLSDYVGKRQPTSLLDPLSAQSSAAREPLEPKPDLLNVSDEQQIKSLFSGMSRSLSYSTARVARNKKVSKFAGSNQSIFRYTFSSKSKHRQ